MILMDSMGETDGSVSVPIVAMAVEVSAALNVRDAKPERADPKYKAFARALALIPCVACSYARA